MREIPVVVIASSGEEADAARVGTPGATAYAIGPLRFRELAHVVQAVPELWLMIQTVEPEILLPEPRLLA